MELSRRLNAPMVALAEDVERLAEPYRWAEHDYMGFAPSVRFMLDRRLRGDRQAAAALAAGVNVVRAVRLGEPFPPDPDAEESYLSDHKDEYDAFVRERYGWLSRPQLADDDGIVRLDSRRNAEYPRANEVFEEALRHLLSDTVPAFRFVKRAQAQPACEFDLGRTVLLGFDRGGRTPRLSAVAFLAVPDFHYRHSLGDSFAFGDGWPEIRTAADDDVPRQVMAFFSSYRRLFPHVLEALRGGIEAGDQYLLSIGISPKGRVSVKGE